MKTFLVGGAVRDLLLGLEPKDLDYVVTGATPEDMINKGFTQVGADFPVFLHPETKDEYALARTERKSGHGYNGFTCEFGSDVTLEEDLGRRDLTINSMAMDQSEGNQIIDPYGGILDLKHKRLKHTTEAFKDDPLRVLRICRFAARYPEFTIHHSTLELMKDMVSSGEIDHLTKERVWLELDKTFTESKPSRFFECLNQVGGLEVLFPEIHAFIGIPQRSDFHAEGDVFVHTMMVIDEAAKLSKEHSLNKKDTIEVVASALWHDVGKAKTPLDLLYYEDGSMKGHHHGHDDEDIVKPILADVKERLKMPNNVFKLVSDVALTHQKVHGLSKMSAKGVVRMFNEFNFKQKGGNDYVNKLLISCHADSLGRKMTVNNEIIDAPKEYNQKTKLIEFFEAYSSVSVKPFIDEYFTKHEKRPVNDLIIQENHRLRLNAIKKLLPVKKRKNQP